MHEKSNIRGTLYVFFFILPHLFDFLKQNSQKNAFFYQSQLRASLM